MPLPSEDPQRQTPKPALNGGIVLVDPDPEHGAVRLRDWRKTDSHAPDCACLHCRQVCCVLCHALDPSIAGFGKVWRGLTGFGRHVQAMHPHVNDYKRGERKTKRLTRQLKELAIAKQAKHFERSGLRRINLKAIGDTELRAISKWVEKARTSDPDRLLLTAIELADERFPNKTSFTQTMRRLQQEVERGVQTGTYLTSQRTTHFDPRVAIEVLKLSYATGRGWSFIVHLLLLYGINSFVETLVSEGLVPPKTGTSLPNPAGLIQHTSKDALLLAKDGDRK